MTTGSVPARRRSRMLRAGAIAALTASLAGCGITIPTDPDGTLESVRGGELRVGFSDEPGLVAAEDGADPTGPLVDLVSGFAERLDAEPQWTEGSEETLVAALEQGDLDLLIGGFTDQTPWIDKAGITRGYDAIPGADGRSLVMLVPLGENAFLSELERYLDGAAA